jgi:hypothetical protein
MDISEWTYWKWWRQRYRKSDMSISDILFFRHTTLFTQPPEFSHLFKYFIKTKSSVSHALLIGTGKSVTEGVKSKVYWEYKILLLTSH